MCCGVVRTKRRVLAVTLCVLAALNSNAEQP
jgi:hypothetical protein